MRLNLFNSVSKKTKHKIVNRLKLYLILTGILLIFLVIFIETQIVPFEMKCVHKEAKSVSIKLINDSVTDVLNKYEPSYSDIAKINYSDKGIVNSIETQGILISKIKSEINNNIQNVLDNDKTYCFSVPIGAFTKLNEFSNLGPDVEISFRLTGSVNCKITSDFESTGVNQTVHHIYLVVEAEVITISPEYSTPININSDYEIAQTVIVGDVPKMYASIEH